MPSVAHAEESIATSPFGDTKLFSIRNTLSIPPGTTSGYAVEQQAAALRSWKRSLLPMVATQSLDIVSSYGMRELNPLLAGPDGQFGAKATSIKIATTAAVVGIEYLLVKKWPGAARMFSKLNWGSSVLTGAIAAHNFAIK